MAVILGINAFHAGASAAILVDGIPVAAIAEERLNRIKYYAKFPSLAIRKCLEIAKLDFSDIDYIAIGRDPLANRNQKIKYALKHPSKWLNFQKIRKSRNNLNSIKELLKTECGASPEKLRFTQYNVEHHIAHIASAYFISSSEKTAGFSMDGSGDFVTCALAKCEGKKIEILNRVYVPHSLGSLYTMICEFIGYDKYGDEGKVMGLAPYGKSSYSKIFNDMIFMKNDGFQINPKYFLPFGANQGLTLDKNGQMIVNRHYSDLMIKLFGQPRDKSQEITDRDKDLAYCVQELFEKVYMHMLNILFQKMPIDHVSMAGGAVLNSVANGKIFDQTPFRKTTIQPAAGDEGLALGAALYVSQSILGEKQRFEMISSYLGPDYSSEAIEKTLKSYHIDYIHLERSQLLEETVQEIIKGNVVGWFQGKMEWGPRALGNRSILAHPGLSNMKDILNARIKKREWFRPFAPAVLAEKQSEIFEHSHPSPFMLHVYKIKTEWRTKLTAVNHDDNTGRLQSVSKEENPLYYDLIKLFGEKTGIPVLLNTSFNENEPIVCKPEEAIECFKRTRMDILVIGNFLCRKINL